MNPGGSCRLICDILWVMIFYTVLTMPFDDMSHVGPDARSNSMEQLLNIAYHVSMPSFLF